MKLKIIIGIWIILIIAGCATPNKPSNTPPILPAEKNPFEGMFQEHANTNGITLNETKTFFSENYKINEEKDLIKHLPKRTNRFNEEQKWLMGGGDGNRLGEISENNFKQPDFWPTFETAGKKTWTHNMGKIGQTIGVMSTPADQEATLNEESESFETFIFVAAGWGANTHQGVKLNTQISPSNSNISVSLEPNEFLIGPGFPIMDENWITRVKVEGLVSKGTKPGTYVITLYLDNPTPKNENEWYVQHANYTRANTAFVDPRGVATLTLTIPE